MRKALGRGLDALIPAAAAKTAESVRGGGAEGPLQVPIERIRANHLQPRKNFDPEKLSELAASIREHGIAQPIVVSYDKVSDTYEIIAGERRLRAAELAGLKQVEVVVRTPQSDRQRLALALVENLQRENLNPIEEALGYLRLMKEFGINQTELTKAVGKSKSAISNTLRLLDLPEDIQKAVEFGQLSEGHARALLMIADPLLRHRVFRSVVDQQLSVRATEDLARGASGKSDEDAPPTKHPEKNADVAALESSLQHFLGTKVEIKSRKNQTSGRITIHYYTLDDFERVVNMLKK